MTVGLRRPLLSLVTDRRRYAPGRMLPTIAAAAGAGVDLVQVREPDLNDGALLALVREVVAATCPPTCVVVNDRADIALAGGAAGVHLRADSVPAASVRGVVPDGFLIGRSVHSVREAEAAAEEGACDYLIFGTVFPSTSKPAGHPVAGLPGLAEVAAAVGARVPVLAIGGISERDAEAIAGTGAAGVAAIGLFASAPDLQALVRSLRRPFDTPFPVV
ncbi:MAG: thiamine phosphate synthase [Acidobacteria bacterium]|nr:thiamine phosphate synthase [Acidobacteriota bacterium]